MTTLDKLRLFSGFNHLQVLFPPPFQSLTYPSSLGASFLSTLLTRSTPNFVFFGFPPSNMIRREEGRVESRWTLLDPILDKLCLFSVFNHHGKMHVCLFSWFSLFSQWFLPSFLQRFSHFSICSLLGLFSQSIVPKLSSCDLAQFHLDLRLGYGKSQTIHETCDFVLIKLAFQPERAKRC
mmetsp:Transcript_1021/g.2075  ORF Transcript_1021/g.2075 Transcript_1021/m.2075 type:complete len:180 (-) Transcript_1021:1168-1707(-)